MAESFSYSSYINFVLSLIFVICLIVLLSWLARRFGLAGNLARLTGNHNNRLQILASLSLDMNRKIVLVGCDDQQYVLLLGPKQDIALYHPMPIETTPPTASNPAQMLTRFSTEGFSGKQPCPLCQSTKDQNDTSANDEQATRQKQEQIPSENQLRDPNP